MTLHELVHKTLDERWTPIVEAKDITELRTIIRHVPYCMFCSTFICSNGNCPLSIHDKCCNGEWAIFIDLAFKRDYASAHAAALKIHARISALLEQDDYEIEERSE